MGSLRAQLLLFLGLEVGETMKSLCGSRGTMPPPKKKKSLAWGWWLVKNYVVLGPHAPWIDLLKPLWLVYAKWSKDMRERPRQAQARTSLLHLPPPCRTYLDSFFWELPTEIQISFPFFSRSSLVPLSSSSFPASPFSSISARQR